ncbi:MAG TPA: ATP-binding protein [Candidatus Saccharimonadales bacterium]|nr:ATP-binding protein [Candidatus Saccharimonadales bacterium]
MRLGIQFRLGAFGAAILMAVVMMSWAVHFTWRRFEALSEKLTPAQIASFQTGDHFRATLQELNAILDRFRAQKNRDDWEIFKRQFDELNKWIDEQRPTLRTAPEVATLNQIDDAYDQYLEAATNLLRQVESNTGGTLPDQSEEKVQTISRTLLNLGYQLVDRHRDSQTEFLKESRRSLEVFRRVIFGALIFLFVVLGWLAIMVYREMIMPLRIKLVESTGIIERQEKLASLGMLAAGVAHEIRNPLTAIKAWLFIQQKKLKPGSIEHADAAMIEHEISRLERIVKDVLLFAKPSEPSFSLMEADKALIEVQALLGPQLRESNIYLQVEPSSHALIRIDPQQIKQVLINLVQNSADSIGSGGNITLRAREDAIRLNDRLQKVIVLEVMDTGKGITPEIQKRLFDPFFTTKDTGTGLGLSIASRIVEKHEGALQYQTQVNRGTTFGIVLPTREK